ncbi:hypothetical protein C7I85_29000 [Mesorhizobium soli]|uniref:Uncharacterized protein n=2 Tax=Pseudaminobacter soli (ex Li et al. 2025) TaxID=1295366 RepID=A0A2P7RPT5_9HYPH|nr:hypothetical protein C7I85_29000 [Mesorhizobium soli]
MGGGFHGFGGPFHGMGGGFHGMSGFHGFRGEEFRSFHGFRGERFHDGRFHHRHFFRDHDTFFIGLGVPWWYPYCDPYVYRYYGTCYPDYYSGY